MAAVHTLPARQPAARRETAAQPSATILQFPRRERAERDHDARNSYAARILTVCGYPVRLDTQRASAAWRAVAKGLAEAAAALLAADEAAAEAAWLEWRRWAVKALETPTGRVSDLRDRLGLAAILNGQRCPIGAGLSPWTLTFGEAVVAAVDQELVRIEWAADHGGEKRPKD